MVGEPPGRLAGGKPEHGGAEEPFDLGRTGRVDTSLLQGGTDAVAHLSGTGRVRRTLEEQRNRMVDDDIVGAIIEVEPTWIDGLLRDLGQNYTGWTA